MTSGELHAWNILDRQPVLAKCDKGVFTELAHTDEPPPEAKWIGPPLVDLQVNGFAGVDFQRDDLTADHLRHAVTALGQAGCNRFCFTLITADWNVMTQRLAKAKQLRDTDPALGQAIAGWHIEGPLLSSEPGYCLSLIHI
mgnify:FL=1